VTTNGKMQNSSSCVKCAKSITPGFYIATVNGCLWIEINDTEIVNFIGPSLIKFLTDLIPDDIMPALPNGGLFTVRSLMDNTSGIQKFSLEDPYNLKFNSHTLLINAYGDPVVDLDIDPQIVTDLFQLVDSQLDSINFVGPAGSAGASGERGEIGIAGPIGQTGPQGIIGVYGPIGITGITGPMGPIGPQGPQGSYGTIAGSFPNYVDLENNAPIGDPSTFYIVEDNGSLYGWNPISGTWTDFGPIAGPQGITGPTGPEGPTGITGGQGMQGIVGPQGAHGSAGSVGTIGPTGQQGEQGLPGITGPNGPLGVVGAVGPEGAVGPTGIIGMTGPSGIEGVVGPSGPTGAQGPIGITGPTGQQGEPGQTGPTGPEGSSGITGVTGSYGPIGSTGIQGPHGTIQGSYDTLADLMQSVPTGEVNSFYYITSTGQIWYWNSNTNSWSSMGTIQGPAGLEGVTGPVGPAGIAGISGNDGPVGIPGNIGLTGNTGPTGLSGEIGPTGAVGDIGIIGPTGSIGPVGPIGIVGPTGATGITGVYGTVGPVGLQGPDGPIGSTGVNGSNGATGLVGPIGLTGATGITGALGSVGNQGPVGIIGPIGVTGQTGLSGLSGQTGAQGPIGATGGLGSVGLTGVTGAVGSVGATGPLMPAGYLLPFATPNNNGSCNTTSAGYAQNLYPICWTQQANSINLASIVTPPLNGLTCTIPNANDAYIMQFTTATNMTIQNIYATFDSVSSITIATGTNVYPFVIIGTAPTSSNVFTMITSTLTPVLTPYTGSVASGTNNLAMKLNINYSIPPLTQVMIFYGAYTTGTTNTTSYNFYVNGSIYIQMI